MRRRTLLFGIAALAGIWVVPADAARTDTGGTLNVDVEIGSEKLDVVLTTLREVDAKNIQQVSSRGLGGNETLVGGVLLAKGLAKLVVRLSSIWKSGIEVDARAARVVTKKNSDLPSDTVLVISPDGTRSKIQQPSESQLQALIENFTRSK